MRGVPVRLGHDVEWVTPGNYVDVLATIPETSSAHTLLQAVFILRRRGDEAVLLLTRDQAEIIAHLQHTPPNVMSFSLRNDLDVSFVRPSPDDAEQDP